MQKRQISKSLDSTIAQAIFSATQLGAKGNFEDILFLEIISNTDSICFQMLSGRLGAQQFEQVETNIRRIVSVSNQSGDELIAEITPDIYYRDLLSALAARYPLSNRLTTLHALHFIMSDNTTATSRMLSKFGVTTPSVETEITQYSSNNLITPILSVGLAPPQRGERAMEHRIVQQKATSHPLEKFGVDLTALAREGNIDPVIGREQETARVVEILSRRKKNNPVLVGEAGVGKSAIVEGLALRIASGDVPHTIRDKHLFMVDISALVAGTKFRGEFEQRMQELLSVLRESRDSIIFIDEIHTIVGAGSTQGSLDTANILKPALARGEIQAIGATTFDEYRANIESDSALERRLQKVTVEPTTVDQSIEILSKIAPQYEQHHGVIYTDDAIEACVKLSDRYINERQLPDKAIDLMDEAGARVVVSKGDNEHVVKVTKDDIEQIVTISTGIEVTSLSKSEIKRLRHLEGDLNSRVIGQRNAVEKLSRTIRRSRAGLADTERPIGVFMFAGPTGVGKTHLAKELSKWMFGSGRSLIRLDMSEYGESHNAARLIGSPPGYVGYGEGGELSEAVRRNPYSVILLDEIEKAHPDIFNIMLQIFDEGHLTDGSGRKIDFRNTIIIMTSNVGSREAAKRSPVLGYSTPSKSAGVVAAPELSYREAMERKFAPEFLNRIDELLLFHPLEQKDIEQIVMLELSRLFDKIREMGYDMKVTAAARRELAELGYEVKYGARALRRKLLELVEEPLADLIIDGRVKRGQSVIVERLRGGSGVKLRVA